MGDRVMAVVGGGGQAELAVVHERHLLPVPDGVAWPEAGGFPEVFTTAYDALFTQCGLAVGERCASTAPPAASGMAGVQLAVAAGARVVATVRNPERRERGGRAAPARSRSIRRASSAHGPFDVVLELVGAPEPRRRPPVARHRRPHRGHRRRRRRPGRA